MSCLSGSLRSVVAALLALLVMAGCAGKTGPVTSPGETGRVAVRPVSPREMAGELDAIFGAAAFDRMQWGVLVQSAATGEVLYRRNSTKLMMPASNMKVVTLAAAAERLGWDFTWQTRVTATGSVEDGTLRGDLVIVGSGDPTINARGGSASRVFQKWADLVAAAGIRRIDGRIVADARAFDREGLGAGWSWDYLGYGYAAPVGALQFNEDVAEVVVRPGAAPGSPASIELRQPESGLVIDNQVTTTSGGSPEISLRRLPGSDRLVVSGSLPVGASETVRAVTVDSPTLYFARAFRAALVARGIEVTGLAVDADHLDVKPLLAGTAPLFTHQSPPLSEVATVLMKVSQNLYAETLLKTLGAQGGGPGSAEAGQKVVRDVLQGWGVAPDAAIIVDGSGLSRYNYLTPEMLARILRQLYLDARHRAPFQSTLPVGGQDGGTIARRFKGTRAEGNVRAKTGSIANVRALSGYVTTLDGEPLVFSIIANNFTQPQAAIDAATDLAVERLANLKR